MYYSLQNGMKIYPYHRLSRKAALVFYVGEMRIISLPPCQRSSMVIGSLRFLKAISHTFQ